MNKRNIVPNQDELYTDVFKDDEYEQFRIKFMDTLIPKLKNYDNKRRINKCSPIY
jgi:hypothetical protein